MAGAAAEVPKRKICTVKLDEGTAAVFRKAVKKHYWHAVWRCPVSGKCMLPHIHSLACSTRAPLQTLHMITFAVSLKHQSLHLSMLSIMGCLFCVKGSNI